MFRSRLPTPTSRRPRRAIEPVVAELGARTACGPERGQGLDSRQRNPQQPGLRGQDVHGSRDEGINILSITTSEIRITCLIERDKVKAAVRALHQVFELEKA